MAKKKKYRVSAIVSTYNSERFIKGCIEDLINQTLYKKRELEIVVVNSGSEQNEEAIVREFQKTYPNIKYIKTDRRETVYAAWNRGIKAASGKYITNANTDDRHRTDALEVMSKALDENTDMQLVYGDCYVSFLPNETFEQNPKNRIYKYPDYFAPSSLLHFQFGPQPMWRKEIHDKIGYFDDSFTAIGDFDFNIRFAFHFKALHIPEPFGVYLKHDNAISFRDNSAAKELGRLYNTYRKFENIGKLYQKEGISFDTTAEKTKALVDLGIRAMEFYLPWDEGRMVADLPFAIQCFQWAAELDPAWAAPFNNMAIALYRGGLQNNALQLLRDVSSKIHDATIDQNLKLIVEAASQQKIPTDLKLIYSDIPLPTQKELYTGVTTDQQSFQQSPTLSQMSQPVDVISDKETPPIDKQDELVKSKNKLPKKDRMRVLLVVHNFPTHCLSGTELYTYNLAQGLRHQGFDVRILYPTYDTAFPVGAVHEYTHEGLSVTSMNIHPPQNFVHTFMNEQAGNALKNYLSGLDLDLVHFHHFIGFSASPLQVCNQIGIPAVVTLHDEWMLCEQYFYLHFDGSYCYEGPETVEKCVQCFVSRHSEMNLIQYIQEISHAFAFRRQYLKNALNWIDTLIVPSKFLQKELKKHGFYHPKTLLIPLGLYTFNPLPWKPQKGLIRFSYVGNINFVKGLDLAIHALNMLNTDNFQLDIYGNVQYPTYFRQVMNTSSKQQVVKYHGPYKPDDLPGIFSQTDIAIVPSRSESYSFLVRECFHASVPVIASNVGGIPEIVKDNVNGLLFRQGDFRDLASKLQLVIRNPEVISSLRKHIKPVRTVSEDAEELKGIYRRILEIKR
jgi:glycosyltransferase involved in cell wall biosynthesis